MLPAVHIEIDAAHTAEPLDRVDWHSAENKHYIVGHFSAWKGKCNSNMMAAFGAPDAYALCLPSLSTNETAIGARCAPTTRAIGFLGSLEHLKEVIEDCSHIGLAFKKPAMVQQASELLNGAITRDLEFDPVVDLTTARGSHLAALGNLVWSCLDIPGAHRFSLEAIEHLFQATMITLLRTVPNNCLPKVAGPLSPAVPWRLKRAIKYMDANLSRSMTVSAIGREAGTSVRALQVAFQRFKGTTPLNYLKTMRLEAARKALLADANCASISDVARNAGFTHMGRFSAAYYQAFGETPSDTIRKR
ncbi:AraC family transcriptional regulator [Rhizobium leguminosarum]|uniref:helix-turn-helix domain-containing protein n=1 Tax=Rhizobium leguminosarum TaxID=384 RepID=UPI001C969274|nr:helix-turn-helix domain-containing protein [Rhizobium leguminosarum]MBY5905437.1 AraC family transcriptional regulator [Rhizobium leguminosarum]MBY5910782.1 AraC family transcriptional regulator [Rhizobium leguminosarum]